ncbi:MAG: anhydro-N-acetylmuramic acid kinase, partial [Planctomycetota bacterium]|nr:anhydro-N-acetylmuramic acid kinase [Planctomycetota bacterium]
IADRFRCRVASDLRGLDRAAGGRGAPITPMADWVLHRGPEARVIVNLGGFINCTILPEEGNDSPRSEVDGFDVCPCNHLLDAVARLALDAPYDDGGTLAQSGTACLSHLELIARHLRGMDGRSRSLGSGDECTEFVPDVLHAIGPADAAATFCAAIAACLQSTLEDCPAETLLLAGGGTRNAALVRAIEERTEPTRSVGRLPHGDEREAASMAVLAALAEDGVPITLPGITGRGTSGIRDGLWCLPESDQTP